MLKLVKLFINFLLRGNLEKIINRSTLFSLKLEFENLIT